jgi:HEAT repeat protein
MSRCALVLSISLLLAPVLALAQAPKPGSGPGGPMPGSGPGGPQKPGAGGGAPATKPPANNPNPPGPGTGGGGIPSLPGGGIPGAPSSPSPANPTNPLSPGAGTNQPVSSYLDHDFSYWLGLIDPPHKDAAWRELAVRVLPVFGSEMLKKAMPKIVDRLRDTDPAVKFAALQVICYNPIEDPKVRDTAVTLIFGGGDGSLIRSTNEMIRLATVNAAAHIGPPAAAAVPSLCDHLRNGAYSYELRKAAAAALGQVGREDTSKAVLAGAVGVTHGPDPRAVRALVDRLNDPCLAVRVEVAHSLMILGAPAEPKDMAAVRNGLTERLRIESDKSLKVWVHVGLIRLNGGTATEKELNPLVESLRSQDGWERLNAAQALGTLGPMAGSKAGALRAGLELKASTKNEDLDFLYMCLWAIGEMGTRASILQKDVQELTNHPDKSVKKMAVETLAKIQGGMRR